MLLDRLRRLSRGSFLEVMPEGASASVTDIHTGMVVNKTLTNMDKG